MNEIITDNNSCIKVSELKPGTLFQCVSDNGYFFMKTNEDMAVDLKDGRLYNAKKYNDTDYENVEILNKLTIHKK